MYQIDMNPESFLSNDTVQNFVKMETGFSCQFFVLGTIKHFVKIEIQRKEYHGARKIIPLNCSMSHCPT